jgi:hypothetical protein
MMMMSKRAGKDPNPTQNDVQGIMEGGRLSIIITMKGIHTDSCSGAARQVPLTTTRHSAGGQHLHDYGRASAKRPGILQYRIYRCFTVGRHSWIPST